MLGIAEMSRAVELRNNKNTLHFKGLEYSLSRFGHTVTDELLSNPQVDHLKSLARDLELTHAAYESTTLVNREDEGWIFGI